jgi:hypothetical protein
VTTAVIIRVETGLARVKVRGSVSAVSACQVECPDLGELGDGEHRHAGRRHDMKLP